MSSNNDNKNNGRIANFMGGNPLSVLIYLIVMSIVVGIVLNALGITPAELLDNILRFIRSIYELGFEAFGKFGEWFLIGAVVVIPVWLISRLFRSR